MTTAERVAEAANELTIPSLTRSRAVPKYDLAAIRRRVARAYREWGYTAPDDILLMTAEQIAATARRAYPDLEVRVIDAVTRVGCGPEAIVTIGGDLDRFQVAIQAVEEGVRGHSYLDDNILLAEWSDPDFAEKVAAGITELGQPYGLAPFPADWLEAAVEDFGPMFASWMEEAWS